MRPATCISGVGCCFCGEGIESTQIDPVTIDLTAHDEEVSQLLWAHARCLVAARMSDLRPEFNEEAWRLGQRRLA